MRTDLVCEDGENKAVRAFLSFYGNQQVMGVGIMADHMESMGWDDHPDWVNDDDGCVLTKGGAQAWIRYLFSLAA